MNNKQNTQFYWEIKDYLPNNDFNEPKTIKKSLKDTIVNIFEQNKSLSNNFNHNTELKRKTNNLLNNYSSNSNPFMLTETLKISAKRPSVNRLNELISSLKAIKQPTDSDETMDTESDIKLSASDILDYSGINLNPLTNVKNKNVVRGTKQTSSLSSSKPSQTTSPLRTIQGQQSQQTPSLNPSIGTSNTSNNSNKSLNQNNALIKKTGEDDTRSLNMNFGYSPRQGEEARKVWTLGINKVDMSADTFKPNNSILYGRSAKNVKKYGSGF
jgi:hypothetical protein